MITLKEYTYDLFDEWNQFIENSNNGTIFHRLDFLSYHGEKFKENEKHLVWRKGGNILAVLPMAIFKENGIRIAKSPYGASWGGFVHSTKIKLSEVFEIVDSLFDFINDNHIDEFYITFPPACYYNFYTNYFEFVLYSKGFTICNRYLTSVVQLPESKDDVWNLIHSKARNSTRKAQKLFTYLPDARAKEFYPILVEDKKRHDNASITHSLNDLIYLQKLDKQVTFDIAIKKDNSKAGICYFWTNNNCIMTFYMAQDDRALGSNGMNYLIYEGMIQAIKKGIKYIDFGTSLSKFEVENKIFGVAKFKERFGAQGYFRDSYKWTRN